MIQWGMNNKTETKKLHRPANVKSKAYLCMCVRAMTGVKLNANRTSTIWHFWNTHSNRKIWKKCRENNKFLFLIHWNSVSSYNLILLWLSKSFIIMFFITISNYNLEWKCFFFPSKLMHKENGCVPFVDKDEIKSETMPFQTWKFDNVLKKRF